MKRIIMLIIYFQLCSSICNAQYIARESDFFPCLDEVVAHYYNSYYKFPTDVKDLIDFAKYAVDTYPGDNGYGSCRANILFKILPYLKENKRNITIIEDFGYTYTIQIGNDTLLYIPPTFWPFSPCEDSLFIGKDPKEYYHFYDHFLIPRFFSSQNKAILYPDSVYQEFKSGVLNIQHKYIIPSNSSKPYKYYIYENDTVPILSMLEYNVNKPIRYYCNGEQIHSKLLFYLKLESFLMHFCDSHKCMRVLFMLPNYIERFDENRKPYNDM